MEYLISPEKLNEQRKQDNVVIIDVRSHLQRPDEGLKAYEESHIPEAYYLHLANDLSSEVQKHGGSHPLPHIEKLAQKLGTFGIDENSKVIIYDAANEMYAPRAWWLLRHIGIDQTFVLNGGFTAWVRAGYEVTNEIPSQCSTIFTPKVGQNETVTMEHVRERDRTCSVLIDSRSYERYVGKIEPLYEKAGHIPGAINFFWEELFDEAGNWKSREQLKDHFASLKDADEIIVSCGSGISACPNILALQMVGFDNVKLYPGSFSDWISYAENVIETKEES